MEPQMYSGQLLAVLYKKMSGTYLRGIFRKKRNIGKYGYIRLMSSNNSDEKTSMQYSCDFLNIHSRENASSTDYSNKNMRIGLSDVQISKDMLILETKNRIFIFHISKRIMQSRLLMNNARKNMKNGGT